MVIDLQEFKRQKCFCDIDNTQVITVGLLAESYQSMDYIMVLLLDTNN